MQIGYIGLGKMGMAMVARLGEKGHRVVAYDVDKNAVRKAARLKSVHGVHSLQELRGTLRDPVTIWIMIPHQFVTLTLKAITPLLKKGDTVIEGGNSPYKDSMRRAKTLSKKGINFLDVGVSGGPGGARSGACLMVGGSARVYKKYKRLFRDLSVPHGYGHMGAHGAGHYVKMVHNGIEYGMMQAIAEGFEIMKREPRFNLDMKKIAKVYEHGSVVESSLITWLRQGFDKFGSNLMKVSGSATESGEGLWTTDAAHALGVPDAIIHESLRARKRSQKKPSYAGKVIMAMRNAFGGHDIDPWKKRRR